MKTRTLLLLSVGVGLMILLAGGVHNQCRPDVAFAKGNQKILEAKGNHPTIGCAVRLERMKDITERLDDLADALLAALRTPPAQSPARQAVVKAITKAILEAQQYDTEAGYRLEAPDQLQQPPPACQEP